MSQENVERLRSAFETFLAGNDHDHRVLSGADNASLLLASKPGVDVGAPVVNSANLKPPTHETSIRAAYSGFETDDRTNSSCHAAFHLSHLVFIDARRYTAGQGQESFS